MAIEEDIMSIVRARGPVLPADVAKGIKTNILIASAYLSELSSRKKVKMSSLKVGGSPVYFIQGQEAKLDNFTANLNEKDLRAYEMLKEKRVLRDAHMTPLMRVALRSIKDFAVPLTVTFGENQELFWKWHLARDDEITQLVRDELGLFEKKNEEPPEQVEQHKKEQEKIETPIEKVFVQEKVEKQKVKRAPKKKKVRKKAPKVKEEEIILSKEKKKKEELKPTREEKNEEVGKIAGKVKKEKTDFNDIVQEFLEKKEIRVMHEEVIRKNSEINYLIEIPSAMGYLRYLCKAQNKKRNTEKDLSAALVEGQLRKLPIVFLYAGTLSPKAKEIAKTEHFKTMVFFQL
jgi:hypothetical protein